MGITFIKNYVQRGFTLLEILIFIAILGVLASIAIPQYQDYLARKQIDESFELIEKLGADMTQTHHHSTFTCTPSSADIASQADTETGEPAAVGLYVDKIVFSGQIDPKTKQGCTATALFKTDGTAAPLSAKKLQFLVDASHDDITFTCLRNGATTISERLLPKQCIVSDTLP